MLPSGRRCLADSRGTSRRPTRSSTSTTSSGRSSSTSSSPSSRRCSDAIINLTSLDALQQKEKEEEAREQRKLEEYAARQRRDMENEKRREAEKQAELERKRQAALARTQAANASSQCALRAPSKSQSYHTRRKKEGPGDGLEWWERQPGGNSRAASRSRSGFGGSLRSESRVPPPAAGTYDSFDTMQGAYLSQ